MRIVAVVAVLFCLGTGAGAQEGISPESDVLYRSRRIRGAFLARAGSARQVAMGEAFTALADDASAVTENPAGLAELHNVSAVAVYGSLGNDQGLSYGAVAFPVKFGVIGVSVLALNYGTYEVRDSNGLKTGSERPMDLGVTIGVGFDHPVWVEGKGSTGFSVEIINESTGDTLGGASVGGLVVIDHRLRGGWVIQHVGPEKDRFSLPSTARAGAAYLVHPQVQCVLDVAYPFVDKQVWIALGGEYVPVTGTAVRLGYKWDTNAVGTGGITGLTAGVGAKFGAFALDYAYQPFGDLATSHRVSISYGMRQGPGKRLRTRAAPARRARSWLHESDARDGDPEVFRWPEEVEDETPAGPMESPTEKH